MDDNAASVALLQRLFVAVIGQQWDGSAVFGTLLVVAALTPVEASQATRRLFEESALGLGAQSGAAITSAQ